MCSGVIFVLFLTTLVALGWQLVTYLFSLAPKCIGYVTIKVHSSTWEIHPINMWWAGDSTQKFVWGLSSPIKL